MIDAFVVAQKAPLADLLRFRSLLEHAVRDGWPLDRFLAALREV